MADANILYKLTGVTKIFPMNKGQVKVLDNLNLTIQRGQWVALTGSSGCGKTTLLHLLGGLDKPTSGTLEFDGLNFAALSSRKLTELRRRRIGFIFQSYHLLPELTSLENAVLPALHWGMDRAAAEKRARAFLEDFGLRSRLTHRPRELSGGEQQRVAIARALVNNPDVILADEPTGNLDKTAAGEIMHIIDSIRKENGKTLVMVTHDRELAAKADTAINLKKIISQ